MDARPLPRKKTLKELEPGNLGPLPMSGEDWEEFANGVELFNDCKFWHAHEAWEQVWKRRPEDSRMFLQGLILMAAALHTLVEKRRYTGTLNNFEKALPRLKLFEPEFMGVKVTPLVRAIQGCREEVCRLGERHLSNFNLKLLPKIEWGA
ncbi:MAG: DUF309 domain-containing protein [Bacteroidota bacterium]